LAARIRAANRVEISEIKRHGADANEHLVRTGHGSGGFGENEIR